MIFTQISAAAAPKRDKTSRSGGTSGIFAGKFAGNCLAFSFRNRYTVGNLYKEEFRMSDEFGPNFITLTDEEGNEVELEYVDVLEHNGQTYMAFFPTVDAEDEESEASAEDYGLVILKSVTVDGEEMLSTPDSDQELNEVYDLFMEQILEDEDENS